MVIDPRKPYTKVTPYPKDIIKILVKLHLFDKFLKDVLEYKARPTSLLDCCI